MTTTIVAMTTAATGAAAMTTDTATIVRTWVTALAVTGFVAIWLLLARSPFPATTRPVPAVPAAVTTAATPLDPQRAALARRERALQVRARDVSRRHAARWAAYRQALGERQQLIRAVQSQPVVVPSFSTTPAAAAPAPAAATTRSS